MSATADKPLDLIAAARKRDALKAQVAELASENTRLRAALAVSKDPCVYCSLPKAEWEKCAHGFPGCGRADDAVGCPELGAALERDALKVQLAEAIAHQDRIEYGYSLSHAAIVKSADDERDALTAKLDKAQQALMQSRDARAVIEALMDVDIKYVHAASAALAHKDHGNADVFREVLRAILANADQPKPVGHL
jgi:hypothetical protein